MHVVFDLLRIVNHVLNILLHLLWFQVVTFCSRPTPVHPNEQAILCETGHPFVAEILPCYFVGFETSICRYGRNDLLHSRPRRPERLRAFAAGRHRCRKTAFVANRPHNARPRHVPVECPCLGARLRHIPFSSLTPKSPAPRLPCTSVRRESRPWKRKPIAS